MKEGAQRLEIPSLLEKITKFGKGLREIISKGKGGQALINEVGDGSLICPYDTLNDCLKPILELFKEQDLNSQFSLWIDLNSPNFYNPELEKYEFENLKKPSEAKDIEDILFKLIVDKPQIKILGDPFIKDHQKNWHKLNVKNLF